MEGAYGGWDDWLPLVQVSLNQAIGRSFNGLGDFTEVESVNDLDKIITKHKDAWKLFRDEVLPGLKTRVTQVKKEQREKMDLRKQVQPILPGEIVWIKDVMKSSKWEPVYEGPYTVLRRNLFTFGCNGRIAA